MIEQIQTTMQTEKLSYSSVPQFSSRDVAYVEDHPDLKPFFKYQVHIDAFGQVIKDKSLAKTDRETLVKVLGNQYANLEVSHLTKANIDSLLDKNTFTITTAHQPSLFTGPLYYIYKIVSVINLCKNLKSHYPAFNFVPVFVTGGEDHDFEEVNHVHLFNKTLEWKNEERGSVGMMKTASLQPVLQELQEILGESENAKKVFELISVTHNRNEKYSSAVIDLVNEIFGTDGLVILNMNNKTLKRIFIPEIKEEIFNNPSINIVGKSRDQIEQAGFKPQAFPREINFFYLKDQLRERIELKEDVYNVLNTDISFTKEELTKEIENHPERFSPNVIIRPLYQEKVLPNLAYIGGGGEIAYWLERKTQFEHFRINFPMLIRRDSVLWVDNTSLKKLKKLNLDYKDLFQKPDDIIRNYVDQQSKEELSLESEKVAMEGIFKNIKNLAEKVDPTLAKSVMAEHVKQQKLLDQLESRIVRAEKHKHDTAINQIKALKEKLFPKDGLQERHDNFLSFYFKYGDNFIETLKQHLNPLEKKMTVILDQN